MEKIRPSIAVGMDETAWVQLQVEMLFARMAAEANNQSYKKMTLSQRLRGIGKAPKDFDYKKELEGRF